MSDVYKQLSNTEIMRQLANLGDADPHARINVPPKVMAELIELAEWKIAHVRHFLRKAKPDDPDLHRAQDDLKQLLKWQKIVRYGMSTALAEAWCEDCKAKHRVH